MAYLTPGNHANPNSFAYFDPGLRAASSRSYKVSSGATSWSSGGMRARSPKQDFFFGRRNLDYHRRRNSGELIPLTHYSRISDYAWEASGPSSYLLQFKQLSTGDIYNVESKWADDSSKPILPHGNVQPEQLYEGSFYTWLDQLGVDPRFFVQRAASKLYSRGWDASTLVAELHKTYRMLGHAILSFGRLVDDFARDVGAGRFLSHRLQDWLEARYGWRILLKDIEDINEVIRRLYAVDRSRNQERVGQNYSHTVDRSFNSAVQSRTLVVSDVQDITVSVRGFVVADFVPSNVQLNPFITAWEIVPYSFVVDWFASVGQALESLSFLACDPKYTSAFGVFVESERTVSHSVYANGGYTILSENISACSVTERFALKARRPVPVPNLPFLRVNLNQLKVLDLVALLGGILERLYRRYR